jgi:hypothetical protein
MTEASTKPTAPKTNWSAVKAALTRDDSAKLLDLLQNLYELSADNKSFFHTRLGLGGDVLKPYKVTIDRWLWPDVMRNQDVSVSKAKKAIADYQKAAGQPEHLAELMVFYCERAAGFSDDVGYANDSFFDALARMFDQALGTITKLPESAQPPLVERLRRVAQLCRNFGYGMDAETADLLAKHGYFR